MQLAKKIICLTAMLSGALATGQTLDRIGVTLLRAVTTNLNGAGIRVAQPEAQVATNPPAWQVNPGLFPQLSGRFTFTSDLGTTNVFPNSLGGESGHADSVASFFYGAADGVATNVAQVDNFEADYFIAALVASNLPVADLVVNQSYIYSPISVPDEIAVNQAFDDNAATYGALFVSGAGNSGPVCPPSTCYNGISVAAYGPNAQSSVGPTRDNGRCKPDLTAPSPDYTSFSTPLVSGAAAVLMQAALRGDGGGDTNSAVDARTVKALLLNGAVKPADWTNMIAMPLDTRYGAGVVNVFNSYMQLAGGKHTFCASNRIASGAAHPPVVGTNSVPATSGWDFRPIAGSVTNDAVNHYLFNISNGTVTATLVWNRHFGETNINNLDLFLYSAANSNLIACSTSQVDNVEHIFVPKLSAGRYDLQVLKNGGANAVSDSESYALAFGFSSTTLNIVKSGTNAQLMWPTYPAGFFVEATTNLVAPAWSTNNLAAAVLTNRANILEVTITNAAQFFRLRQPNF